MKRKRQTVMTCIHHILVPGERGFKKDKLQKKNILKKKLICGGQQFHQYQQSEQSSLTFEHK
jgi:hypothetical protein